MAATVQISFAAVRFVDPASDTMTVNEGFETPYIAEITTQEGEYFTTAQMEAITSLRLYFGDTEYVSSTTCAGCFNYTTYKASSKIVIDVASYNWTDGTATATLFMYSATYPDGLRVGTFTMTSEGTIQSGTQTPETVDYIAETEMDTFSEWITQVGVTGTPTGTKYLRDDGTFQTVSSGSTDPDALDGDTVDDNKVDTAILKTATPANGTTDSVSTADQIYDWVIGLGYSTFNGAYSSLSGIPSTFTPASHGDSAHSETYLKAEVDPTVNTSAEIQAIIGAGVYEPAFDYGTDPGEINTDDIPEGSTHFYDDDGVDAVNDADNDPTNENQVGDGVTISGAGTALDPFVAVGDGTGTDDQTASEVAITDTGNNTTETEVEGALAEIYDAIEGILAWTSSVISVVTTAFNGIFSNTTGYDTVQECLDAVDDHTHTDTISHERGGLEADVSAYSGVLKITGGSTGYIKYDFATTVTPGVNHDVSDGWSVGSKIYETDADKEWTCLDTADGAAVWSEGGGGTSFYVSKVIAFPDILQIEADDWPIFPIEAEEYPSGVTITDIGIKTPTSSSYTISLYEYASPDDVSPVTIEAGIATSTSYEAEDDGTLADGAVAAGSIIYIDLDTDDVSWVQVWIKGTIN